MFADLDESIRQLLIQRGNLDAGEVDIAFEMPTREWAAGISRPTVNLYLYDISENSELKNPAPWVVRRGPDNTAIKSRPEARFDLTYKVTAFANTIEDEHRLLSRALVTLLQHPVLPAELLQGQVAGQEIPTSVAQPVGAMKSPADYWGAMDNDIKPALDLRATLKVDLSQEISVGIALTQKVSVGRIDGSNGRTAVEESPLNIGGRVHRADDQESGIPGAAVTLLERGLDTTTNDEGFFQFFGVLPGSYTLVVSPPDAEEETRTIEVPSGKYDVGI